MLCIHKQYFVEPVQTTLSVANMHDAEFSKTLLFVVKELKLANLFYKIYDYTSVNLCEDLYKLVLRAIRLRRNFLPVYHYSLCWLVLKSEDYLLTARRS